MRIQKLTRWKVQDKYKYWHDITKNLIKLNIMFKKNKNFMKQVKYLKLKLFGNKNQWRVVRPDSVLYWALKFSFFFFIWYERW